MGAGGTISATLPKGGDGGQFGGIVVDGGYDTLIITANTGSFKIGELAYTELHPQDVTLQFGYGGADADGDHLAGAFDVTISADQDTGLLDQIVPTLDLDHHLV